MPGKVWLPTWMLLKFRLKEPRNSFCNVGVKLWNSETEYM